MSTYTFPPAGYPYRTASGPTDIATDTVVAAATINALIERSLGFLPVNVLVDYPVDVNDTITAPIPSGLLVLLNAQTDPDEDGVYLSDGSGGITGSPVPVKTLANYLGRLLVFAQVALTDVNSSPPGTFYDPNTRPGDQNYVELRMVTTPDGSNFFLSPQGIPTQAWMDQSGKSYTPAMNDFGGVNTNLQLTVNHQIVSCNPSSNITLTMPPHLTKPRHCYITVEPTATANVTIVEYPGETDFSHTLGPGERALILPDQALWEVWQFPKAGETPGAAIHAGNTPTVAAGADAGSGASVVSDPQTDSWGTVAVTAGTSAAAGELIVVTFDQLWLYPSIQITPRNADSAGIGAYVVPTLDGADTESFAIHTTGTPINGVTYRWDYMVLGDQS